MLIATRMVQEALVPVNRRIVQRQTAIHQQGLYKPDLADVRHNVLGSMHRSEIKNG